MYAVKLGSHLAQLLGVYDFEEFIELGAQPAFLRAVSLGYRLVQRLHARIFLGPGFNLTGENHGRRRSAADHGGIRSLQGCHFNAFIQRPRENHVCASVIARDHAKDDGAFEVHHRSPDLGAVLELQPAHRLRRAIKPRQVGQDHYRSIVAGRVDRARDFLRRLREECAGSPLLRPVGGNKSQPGQWPGFDTK